jgi:hypothetical protein
MVAVGWFFWLVIIGANPYDPTYNELMFRSWARFWFQNAILGYLIGFPPSVLLTVAIEKTGLGGVV